MIKKIINFFIITIILIYISSCIKENNMATNYGVSIPFNDTMGIVSVLSKCSGSNCHSPGGKEVSEFLYDPNDYERSIKKNISKIYNETKTYGKGMANF